MLARLRLLLVVALSALLLPAAASAQQGSVTGTVTDAQTGFTLAGATVQIESLGRGAITNESGRFALLGLPAGSHTISVTYLGYGVTTQSVQIEAGEVANVDIALEAEVIALEGLQVTGQRAGQAAALNQQLTSLNITNVIAADQIGRFPDSNIGDALKRVPGIVVIQDQGEARFGLIRGTEPRFNSVMVNGERIPSAEAEVREVQLDLIPADMVSQVEVSKALTPDMDADAIGGAVNIVTRAAPSQRRVSATLGSGINFLSDQPIGIGSLVYGDRFFNDKLGAVFSGSLFSHNLGSDNIEAEWDQTGAGDAYLADFQIREYQIERVRRSVSASFDYDLSEGNTLIWRSIYNTRDDWENRFRNRIRLDEPDANGVQEASIERETKGGIGNDRVDFRRLEDQRTQSHSLSGEHIFGGGVQFEWSGQFAQASEERLNERYINYAAEGLSVVADLSDTRNPFADPVNALGARPTSGDFELDELTEETQFTRDRDFNFRADLTIPLRDGQTELKVGGRYRGKEKLRENDFFEYEPTGGQFSTLADVPLNDYSNPGYLAGSQYQIGDFATQRFLGNLDLAGGQFDREVALGEFAADNFEAEETITGGYLMVTQQFGPRTSAIAGVRVETTDNAYTGNIFNDNTGEVEPTTAETSYTDVFPSIQVRHELGDRTVLRGAWTNTIARPNYFQLTPFRVIEDLEVEVGNPNLDPTRSMNFDLMFESYFDNVGIFQAGIFHKEIEDFIVGRVTQDVVLDGQLFDQLTEPFNGASARLTGFEIAFQRNLDFLPGFLAGLGVYANYTYTNSSVEDIGIEGRETEDLPLPGTSENTFNGSISYDRGRINLRASVNFQDDFIDPGELGSVAFFDRYYEAQTQVDLNGSVALTRSAQFFFEVNNLTNEPLAYYQGIPSRLMQREFYDTRIQTGLKIDVN